MDNVISLESIREQKAETARQHEGLSLESLKWLVAAAKELRRLRDSVDPHDPAHGYLDIAHKAAVEAGFMGSEGLL